MILTQHQISRSVRPVSNHYENSAAFTGAGWLTSRKVTDVPSRKLTDDRVSFMAELIPQKH